MECRCPSCCHLFKVRSSDFGAEVICPSCGHTLMLDTDKLAHFEFPSEIIVRLADPLGDVVRASGLNIHAKRGFPLGEVPTDADGTAHITRDHYERSRMEWSSWSIMDHPGDHSLVRYLTLLVDGPRPFGPERLDLENAGHNPTVWLRESH